MTIFDFFRSSRSRVCLTVISYWASYLAIANPLFAQSASSETLLPDYSHELPRIPPLGIDEALKSFKVLSGYRMELVASEPLIGSPVAVEWDESGAMFVCEMRGYSENRHDGISAIAKLTDEDGDGRYDKRITFADGLMWPTGLYPYDGGFFVGDAPDLLYLKDTDGDGKADLKQRVLTGFGTSNVQGLMNSFRWGLDNRIHIGCSSNGGDIRYAHGLENSPAVSIRGRDIAFDPRTYEFEATSGAAQHGVCFDDWGRKFVSSNSDHIQQVMYEDRYVARNPFFIPLPSRISIATDGPQAEVYRISPVEPWRVVRTRLRVSGLAKGPIEGGGRSAGYFTGATGVTIYRGDQLPAELKGMAFIGDVGSNLIHRKQIEMKGLERTATRIDNQSEFIASSDIWFRPAQFANGPDGALYVIDMYREVIEHPLSLPEEIKKHLDLTSGRDRGRIYRVVPEGNTAKRDLDFSIHSVKELVAMLAHENAWHRERAARLLFEKQDSRAIPLLQTSARSNKSALGRLHALYALQGLKGLDVETLKTSLRDDNPQVRRHAVKLCELHMESSDLMDVLAKLVDDPSIEVRHQLAYSLVFARAEQRLVLLGKLAARDPHDRWMANAVLCSVGKDGKQFRSMIEVAPAISGKWDPAFLKQLEVMIAAEDRFTRDGRTTDFRPITSVSMSSRSTESVEHRKAVVERYKDVVQLSGDVNRGRQLFKKNCSGCHRFEGIGFEIGPSLATARSRGVSSMLESILDPSREVNPLYLQYLVSTTDGKVHSGMIVDEGASSLVLRRAENVSESILRIEIDEMKNTGMSIMPEGFEEAMDKQAIADLLTYLMSS